METIMNNPSHPPVFVLSCERSGSTLLRYLIDTHSKIACPSHLYLGNLCESLNRTLTGTLAQNQDGLDEAGKKQFAIGETRKIVANIMDRYLAAKNKPVWCEKTPMNLDCLPLLDAHFPDARYICLYRHCQDVVHSSINLSKFRFLPEHVPYVHRNPDNIIAAMTENWLEKTARLLAFEAAHRERCFRVRYEDVVLRPEETLAPLFRFLGVGWEEELMARVFEVGHDGGEGDGRAALSSRIRQDSVGNGVEVPRAGIPGKFVEKIDRLLGELDYGCLEGYYAKKPALVRDEKPQGDNLSALFDNRFAAAVRQNRARYPALSGVWKIALAGDAGRAWVIDLSGPEGVVREGDFAADITLRLSAMLLAEMADGKRDAVEAVSQGEIEITGTDDVESLMNLGRLLFS